MWVVVETHEPGQERCGNQQRGMCVDRSHHKFGISEVNRERIDSKENIVRRNEVSRQATSPRSMNVSISAMLRPEDTKQAEVKVTRRFNRLWNNLRYT
jgi:hypothetical protein